jgi:GAF domain-containing protein
LTGAWPKSALFMPLLVEGQVRTIISIQDLDFENAFSSSDVQLLQAICNAMAVALENARLFDETKHLLKETENRAQELATINTVSAALAAELDLNTLIELVGQQVRSVFKADIAFVALLDQEKGMINFPYQYGQQLDPIRFGQGLTSKIIQSGQPLLINEDMDRQRQRMRVKLIGKRARSFLGVPIFVTGKVIGAVSVQSTKQEGRFTENDRRLLSTIAANVSSAFQNARLFHETQRLFQAERQAHEQAETLRSVAQALNRSLSLTEVLNLVLTEIQKVIPYDSAGMYRVDGNRRVFVAGRGFANLENLIGVSFKFNPQEDEIGYLISRSLQPLILEDAPEKYPQYFSTGSHAETKIRSYMAFRSCSTRD